MFLFAVVLVMCGIINDNINRNFNHACMARYYYHFRDSIILDTCKVTIARYTFVYQFCIL